MGCRRVRSALVRFASYPARRVRWWHSGAEVGAPPAACRWPRLAVRRATPSNPNGLAWLVIRFGAVRKSARQRATQLVASHRIAVSSGWRALPHVAGPAISGSLRSRPGKADPRSLRSSCPNGRAFHRLDVCRGNMWGRPLREGVSRRPPTGPVARQALWGSGAQVLRRRRWRRDAPRPLAGAGLRRPGGIDR